MRSLRCSFVGHADVSLALARRESASSAPKSLRPGGGMADTTVLEAVAVRRAGSSPVLGTINGLRVVGDFDVTCSYTLSYTGSWL